MAESTRVLILGRQAIAETCTRVEDVASSLVVASLEEALDEARQGAVNLIILDMQMPGVSGIDRLRRIREQLPSLPVIVIADDGVGSQFDEAIAAGAAGVLKREASVEEFAEAISTVRAGGSHLDPERANYLIQRIVGVQSEARASDPGLTPRELEVLRHLADGLSARQISTRLSLSERTINTYVANLYRKLDVSNRVEAIREAMRMKLIEPPE